LRIGTDGFRSLIGSDYVAHDPSSADSTEMNDEE